MVRLVRIHTAFLAAAAAGVVAASGALPAAPALAGSGEGPAAPRWSQAANRPVLRTGDHGRWVRRLNRALHVAPATKTFHAGTARAVRRFRAEHGLKGRAVVNARVWRLLFPPIAPAAAPAPPPEAPQTTPAAQPELRYGDTSAWVQAWQEALGVQPASGWFGPMTQAAVRAAQSAAGLPATGVVDAATWLHLGGSVAPPPPDPTMTDAARNSRAARQAVGTAAFAASWSARFVVDRESGGQCTAVSPNGMWRGKWQMDAAFWAQYGGTALAPTPDAATCEQQDSIAYRGWVDRWWDPWRTATFPG